jgi:hypothetical protein
MARKRLAPNDPREWLNRARSNLARAERPLPDAYLGPEKVTSTKFGKDRQGGEEKVTATKYGAHGCLTPLILSTSPRFGGCHLLLFNTSCVPVSTPGFFASPWRNASRPAATAAKRGMVQNRLSAGNTW